MDALSLHRLHFAFTITYHYLFPQLTMGLAMLIVVFKALAMRRGDGACAAAARFWARIFGVAFVMGVVTGIPMEFQFGTNWSRFSRASGGVIGQVLAIEGVFAFFIESSFLYLLLFRERQLGPRLHMGAAVMVWLGTWLSGYFIVCTNAFMQHPTGYHMAADGTLELQSLAALFTNPWALIQYAHTMVGSVITASFVVAGTGAFYRLRGLHPSAAQRFLGVGVVTGMIASHLAAMPTGDLQAKLVLEHQPVTFAAMEGQFHTEHGVGLTLIGQPNVEAQRLDNPVTLPRVLSILTHQRWDSEIRGLNDFPRDTWPDNIPLLYYGYHIMAGLGTLFIALMTAAAFLLWRGRLTQSRPVLWALMLSLPLPFVANTAGWMTAELGRQPWLIYGLMRTRDGHSLQVSSGNALFSLLGFLGLYALLSLLYFFVITRILAQGPGDDPDPKETA